MADLFLLLAWIIILSGMLLIAGLIGAVIERFWRKK